MCCGATSGVGVNNPWRSPDHLVGFMGRAHGRGGIWEKKGVKGEEGQKGNEG